MHANYLSERLDEAVKKIGNIGQACEAAGITYTTLTRWKDGTSDPKVSNIVAFAQAAGVSLDWLLLGEEKTETDTSSALQFNKEQWQRFETTLKKLGDTKTIHIITNTPPHTIQNWHNHTQTPTMPQLIEITKLTQTSLDWLLLGTTTTQPTTNEYAYIPAYDIEASTGAGIFNEDTTKPTRHLAFRTNWLNDKKLQIKNLAVIYTKGDSMMPTIPEKSAVLIDRSRNQALDGRIYVIRIDDRLYVKRTQWLPTGLRLISDNKELYTPIDITKAELEHDNIEIIGQVIHVNYDLPD